MQYTFGVDVGGTAIKYGLFGDGLIEKWSSPTRVDATGSQILPDIAAALAACQARHSITPGQIAGIGIGVPGPVDAAGRVNRCVNLNWGVFNICQALEALTGLPVRAGNDANVAALGEYYDGGGQGCRSMVMVTFGTGVGGGIILDGKILNGAHGVGGEIGHIVVNRDEPVACTCGKRGCVEQYASAPGICRAAQQALAATDAPSLLRRLDPLTCKDIFACAAQGDAVAAQVLDRTFAYMGEFLADVLLRDRPAAGRAGRRRLRSGAAAASRHCAPLPPVHVPRLPRHGICPGHPGQRRRDLRRSQPVPVRPLMRKKRAALLSFWKRSAFFRFFSPQGPFYSAEIRK